MNELTWQLIEFRQPWWLLLALQPLFFRLFVSIRYRQHRSHYADDNLLPWVIRQRNKVSKRWLRSGLFAIFWIFIAISMAGPRTPDNTVPTSSAARSDIMLVIDLSYSMTATDISPERFSRVRSEVFHILENNKTDRIGMVVYAGDAYLLSPLTWDRQVSRFFLESIKIGMLPTQGSHIQSAIRLANRELQDSLTGTIFLFTDGEVHETFNLTDDLIQAPLFILGVGTEQGASLLSEDGTWLRYKNTAVHSSLHSVVLRQLAKASKGAYMTADRELGRLHRDYVGSLAKRKALSQQKGKSWHEWYAWTLIPALLLLIGLSIRMNHFHLAQAIAPLLVVFVFTSLLSAQTVVAASIGNKQLLTAWQAYSKGDYIQAAQLYARFEGYDARMGEGASAYKSNDFSRATTQFTRAFLMAAEDRQRANALYNLANSYFKKAQYELAQSTYEDVLRYLPEHQHALSNIEFVKSLIKTLANDPFAASLAAKRAGRGPRSIYAREDTEGAGDFSLDDEPVKKESMTNRQRDRGSKLSNRIASGQTRVQVADDQFRTSQARQFKAVTTRQIIAARQLIQEQQRAQSDLWKSLLESEAGFPAPVQQPIIAPGDLPW